jgi:transaldolase/glucose-6-phosphate isomerase
MAELYAINELGQSVWLNYLRRSFIESGELRGVLEAGVSGITATPLIFEKAITDSSDYDQRLANLVRQGMPVKEMYRALVVDDIQRAADLLMPIFELTEGRDGFVTMELDPALAHNTTGTIAEARHLQAIVNRPNVMMEIPATRAGIAALEALTRDGVNTNATHIFSLATYDRVAEAYRNGLAAYIDSHSVWRQTPASVASFSLSRVDHLVDARLSSLGRRDLMGKAAIALAKVIYVHFCHRFSGPEWHKLERKGAKVQRPKWSRTTPSTFRYFDTYYLEALIGPDTVCTVSPAGLNAFRDHGRATSQLSQHIEGAQRALSDLEEAGIDLESLAAELQHQSLSDFDRYHQALVRSVSGKRGQLEEQWHRIVCHPARFEPKTERALQNFCEERVMCRIWAHDHTVWRDDPQEIVNRLGWLHIVDLMQENVADLASFVDYARKDGFEQAVVLGMGGSSLAPNLFAETFGPWARLSQPESPPLALSVLDTSDPDAIRALEARLDLERTLFIVASKSGGTVETLSAFKYFYNRFQVVGLDSPGRHFVAITDLGTTLVDLAEQYSFRATFLNDPTIGGRYSALSFFGLLPAALAGVDLALLLDRAQGMVVNSHSCNCPMKGDNLPAQLGVLMGQMALLGRNKLTLVTSRPIQSFANWVEQLVAESTGKEGKGILPVAGETLGPPEVYGDDRLFVHLRLDQDSSDDDAIQALVDAGQPVVVLHLRDTYDLGAMFFAWEVATAIAGHFLSINPFDQPDVESAKRLARQLLDRSGHDGRSAPFAELTTEILDDFLATAGPGDYIALQAYVPPADGMDAVLQDLRLLLRDHYRLATTVGYGPRYLHSTGQLHKGGPAGGHFIQFVSEPAADLAIPDHAGSPEARTTFGALKKAQAQGDAQALLNARRKIIRFEVGSDAEDDLRRFLEALRVRQRAALRQPA